MSAWILFGAWVSSCWVIIHANLKYNPRDGMKTEQELRRYEELADLSFQGQFYPSQWIEAIQVGVLDLVAEVRRLNAKLEERR